MTLGVVLYNEVAEIGISAQLAETNPSSIIINIVEPKDVGNIERFVEFTSNIFPMFTLGANTPFMLSGMMRQAAVVTDRPTFYLKVGAKLQDGYIKEFLKEMATQFTPWGKPTIYLVSPAGHFLEISEASILQKELFVMGIAARPCYLFSNAPAAQGILDDPDFQGHMNAFDASQIMIAFVEGYPNNISALLQLEKTVYLIGLKNYKEIVRNSAIVNGSMQYIPGTVIAIAKVKKDRSSAWRDSTLSTVTTRKFNTKDKIKIVEFLNEKVAKTLEGDYIDRSKFDFNVF